MKQQLLIVITSNIDEDSVFPGIAYALRRLLKRQKIYKCTITVDRKPLPGDN